MSVIGEGNYPFQLSESEWRERLTPDEYAILREAATERAGTGELLGQWGDGLYSCRGCGAELFKSGTKFESHCGWPSFYESINPDAVELLEDTTLGQVRTEVRCANCGSHLGHVFPDGFGTPTGNRFLHELARPRFRGAVSLESFALSVALSRTGFRLAPCRYGSRAGLSLALSAR